MRTIFIVPVLLAAFAAPAWASQCPRSIAALDDMLRQHGSMLSPDKATEVKALRNKAEQAHAAGKHDESLQAVRSEEHTSELQSLMRISYAVFCLKKTTNTSHT